MDTLSEFLIGVIFDALDFESKIAFGSCSKYHRTLLNRYIEVLYGFRNHPIWKLMLNYRIIRPMPGNGIMDIYIVRKPRKKYAN